MYQQNRICWYTPGMVTIEELPFVAGEPALDFVNTAEQRGHPDASDFLRSPADLWKWGRRYGLLGRSVRSADAEGEFARARRARELLYAIFLAQVQRRAVPPNQLDALGTLGAAAYAAATLRPGPDGGLEWRWTPSDLESVRHIAVASAIRLLEGAPSERLKQCPGDHCGWFFLDRTKRGNRRWCSMSECGQDEKDRRRRRRLDASS
jgi:predicted RNA-binding Zn ribbon-like protein